MPADPKHAASRSDSDGGDRNPGLAVGAGVDRPTPAGRFDSSVAPPPRESFSAARVTHGRHCPCSACAREDWTRITGPCGMHGKDCPAVYAPISTAASDPKHAACRRIRFTIEATTTLESLWYDEQWHRELVSEGLTDEQALKGMIRAGFEEDGLSILWEMFGPPPETAKYFAQAVRDVCLV